MTLQTNGREHFLRISPLASLAKGRRTGLSINGGELLFLALATCYCDDLADKILVPYLDRERHRSLIQQIFF